MSSGREGSDRRLALSLFVLLALAESLFVGISPLLPYYQSRLSLSGFSVSALLAGASFALLLAGIPAGLVAERIGVRRVTFFATAVLCIASFVQVDPLSYAYLLIDRVAIGAAVGVFWTSGLAWLAELPEAHSSALGIGITMAGVGLVLGPGFVGVTAQVLGSAAPFLVIGVAIAATMAVLATTESHSPVVPYEAMPSRLSVALAAAARRPGLRSALIALSASAVAAGAIAVILPLELHRDGASTGTIGVVLFITGLGYVAASAAVARLGGRMVSGREITLLTAALGIVALPGSLSRSAAALVLTAFLITPVRGALANLCYELGSRAAGDGVRAPAIIGCLNSLWGAVSVVSPLAAGAIFDAAGGRMAFAGAQCVILVAAAGTALSRRGRTTPT